MPLFPARNLLWVFDYSWDDESGVPYVDVLEALHHGAGCIVTRVDGTKVLGRWDATAELRSFANMAWPGERLSNNAFTAAHWAAGWAEALAGQHAAARIHRQNAPPDQHEVPIRSGGRVLALLVNGDVKKGRPSPELHESMMAPAHQAENEVHAQLAEDLEGRLLDMGKLKEVQLRCNHCGEAVRGRDREEAQIKLHQHKQKAHGFWR